MALPLLQAHRKQGPGMCDAVQRVHCCEVCGVVSHESCVRKVSHDCRPAAEAGDRMLHLWKPAGVVMYDSEVGLVSTLNSSI